MQPRTAAVVNLCATVYPYNHYKGDRRQKTIIRADLTVWRAFQHLANYVDFNNRLSGKVLYVDFDLMLADVDSQQQPASPHAIRTRPVTATMIKSEDWLEDVDKDNCTIEAPFDRVKLALF